MNMVVVHYHISRIAQAALSKVKGPENFGYLLELFFDAVFYEGYKDFSTNHRHAPASEKARFVSGKIFVHPRHAKILRRFQIMGYPISWVLEETLFFSHKKGLLV
ncbi:MAG: hypothetical protein NZM25_06630 [Leptospiraceae bacterium]|nr:hypothetical protein [Leptospiraceae bacterium]